MERVTLDLLDGQIIELLRQLEKLQLVRFVQEMTPEPPQRNWAGSISSATADSMLDHLKKSRDEWDRI
jgi:hypothetical protein